MSIDTYTRAICLFYLGLFLCFVVAGGLEILRIIRKGSPRYWWGIMPCGILYSFTAFVSTSSAAMAYNDISDPNYVRYAGWELPNFIFHDIRMPVIWLLIGLAVYFTSKSKWKIQILAAIAVLMVILMILWVVTWQPPCCIYLVR